MNPSFISLFQGDLTKKLAQGIILGESMMMAMLPISHKPNKSLSMKILFYHIFKLEVVFQHFSNKLESMELVENSAFQETKL